MLYSGIFPHFTLKNVETHVRYRVLVASIVGAFVVFPYIINKIDTS
jgi:hypothetical protein